jgi:hypothetical protein
MGQGGRGVSLRQEILWEIQMPCATRVFVHLLLF